MQWIHTMHEEPTGPKAAWGLQIHSRWTEFSIFLSREINLTCRVVTNGALTGRRGRWVCREMEGEDETARWMGPEPGSHGLTAAPGRPAGAEQLGALASERAGPRVPSGIPQTRSARLPSRHTLNLTKLSCPHLYAGDGKSTKIRGWLGEKPCQALSMSGWEGRWRSEGHLRGVSPTERLTGESLKPRGESWEFPSVWDFIHSLMGQESKLGYWKRTYFSPLREAQGKKSDMTWI